MQSKIFSLLMLLFLPFFSACEKGGKESAALDRNEPSAHQKICLNMIVKDESRVIQRCLDSVKPVIDFWVIVDTGSKDGTQDIIKKHMKGIPGILLERPWKNWGETRTEALKLAQKHGKNCDYILFMDADDVLEYDPEKKIPALTADQYNLWRGSKGFTYLKPQFVKMDMPWKWVGVTHEYLACDTAYHSEILEGVRYVDTGGGARSYDPKKFWKNVDLLEADLKKDPDNSRSAFYLAESYRDAGEKGKALQWFQKRVQIGGWHEETYWSKLQIGHLLDQMGLPPKIVAESYIDAYLFRPHRPEAVYYLAEIFNRMREHRKAYELLKIYEQIPKPEQKDVLFNIDWIPEYGLLFQLSICSYYAEQYEESLAACDKLLKIDDLPEYWRTQTEKNRIFPLEKLKTVEE